MAQSAASSRSETSWEGSHHEVLEGIHLVGEEAPSFPVDPLLRAGLGQELRRMQERAQRGDRLARRYVGTWRKLVD
ncbi:MAG: hypothetical protein U1F66_04455 [bacterium]